MIATILLTVIASFLITLLIRNFAIKHHQLDIPNARSSHQRPTPRGAGAAIVVVFTIGLLVLTVSDKFDLDNFQTIAIPGLLVAIIGYLDDHGKVIARGTSDALKKQVGGERLEIVVESQNIAKAMEVVATVSGNKASLDEGLRMISAPVSTGATALIETLRSLDAAGIHPLDVGLKRPSLDDVFLSLTGHAAEEKSEEVEVTGRRKKAKK